MYVVRLKLKFLFLNFLQCWEWIWYEMASQIIGFIPKLTQIDFPNVSIWVSVMDYLRKHKNCLWADTSVKTVANFHVLSSRRMGKKRISGEWSPKINGNWISTDRTEKWTERAVRGPGISSRQSLPVIEFTSTPYLSQLWFFSPHQTRLQKSDYSRLWNTLIIDASH